MRPVSAPMVSSPELSLAPVTSTPSVQSWPAAVVRSTQALDTRFWQTRGARGISWNRSGMLPIRRLTH